MIKLGMSSKRVLFVGAHFDDEVFVLQKLLDHVAAGDDIRWLWVTVPVKEHDKKSRIDEHEHAMQFLEVKQVDRVQLGYPDRHTHEYIKQIYLDLNKEIHHYKPDVIYVTAFEGGNIDHDVVNFLVYTISKLHPDLGLSIWEYQLYNAYLRGYSFLPYNFGKFLPREGVKTMRRSLMESESEFIRSYLQVYKSQYWKTELFMRAFDRKDNVFHVEKYRQLPDHNYYRRPYKKLPYESYQGIKFSEFRNSIQFLLSDLLPDKRTHADVLPGTAEGILHHRSWQRIVLANINRWLRNR